MTWAMISLLVAAALAYLFWSGRRPIHYRGVDRSEFSEFLENRLRDAVGSRLIVEDESSHVTVVVEKVFADATAQEFRIWSRGCDAVREARVAKGRGPGEIAKALSSLLTVVASGEGSTYHLYFQARPDPEGLRAKYEEDLRRSDASDFRRRVAKAGLEVLDERARRNRDTRS
jgi:hypothetical protein